MDHFKYNPKRKLYKPNFEDTASERIDSEQLCKFDIYVTEKDYFTANFQDIFNNEDYIINFTTKQDDKRWDSNPLVSGSAKLILLVRVQQILVEFLNIICSVNHYQT